MRKVIDFHIVKPKEQQFHYQVDQSNFYPFFHRHDEIQISLLLVDTNAIIADQILPIPAGSIVIIGSNIPHLFQEQQAAIKSQDIMLSIFLPSPNPPNFLYELSELLFLKKLVQEANTPHILENNPKLTKGFQALFQEDQPKQFLHTLDFLIHLSQAERKKIPVAKNLELSEKEGKRLNDVIGYMMDQIERDISLGEIAKLACLSPTSFCRFFKQHTGQSFQKFFKTLKMQKAAQDLLSSPELAIQDIALGLGFFNQSSFNRVFKSIYKLSPSSYRKLNS